MNQNGYFLFSLDTELAWGFFDQDRRRARLFSPDGSRERKTIVRLLDIFDEFDINVTWAITGHLFLEKCEQCEICPVLAWKSKYQCFDEIYKTNAPLWYGSDIVEKILEREKGHEIAFHGYTHQEFDESRMSVEHAQIEIQEWLRVARGILPQAVVFPRNVSGYLDVFKEAGFTCYRGLEPDPGLYKLRYIGKLIKHLDHILSVSTPQIFELGNFEQDGLVNFYGSQAFFGFNRTLELILDSLHLENLRLRRMVRAIRKAANEKKIVHIYAHPWEFRSERDFEKLRYLLAYVSEEIRSQRMVSIGMGALARLVLQRTGLAELPLPS